MNRIEKRGRPKKSDFMNISDRKIINNLVHYKVNLQSKSIDESLSKRKNLVFRVH